MDNLKHGATSKIFIFVGVAITFSLLHAAQPHQLVPIAPTFNLPTGVINVTPTNMTSFNLAPVPAELLTSNLSEGLVTSVVQSQVVPFAIATLAAQMKNPYILLVAAQGVAVAYYLSGSPVVPQNMGQQLLQSMENNMALIAAPAVKGAVVSAAGSLSLKLVGSQYSGYMKPLIAGGSIIGAGAAYFSPNLSDQEKAIAFAGVSAAIGPVVQNIIAPLISKAGTSLQQKAIALAEMAQEKKAVSAVAVALIALGGVVTTVQALQTGEIDLAAQAMAGVTLANVLALSQEWAVYEYGYRATQKVMNIGSKVMTHIISEPIKESGRRIMNGVWNAFGWGSAAENP
jgi:hypothetical protein